jgi:hypothetical protein
MCGQTALVLIFMILVFGVECKGDVFSAVVLTILQGLCGMCFGELLSLMLKHLYQIALLDGQLASSHSGSIDG